ncbi:hypothetical protein [Halomonas sp. LBP4]|uniref:hypothetical protein n=1 Tax=Halomonas sp. LBP4 TaxID=2044917 RepID=UPI000D76BF22|nr:hypothetical protein [Halomonas sp. LBP4]PXX95815.1 hypothetical protein CR157_16560 [Halomonas sp. LBP4]
MTAETEGKDRLGQDLLIVLEEAASRGNPDDAVVVIAGTLADIAERRAELRELAEQWLQMSAKTCRVA